ncbi:MAG: excinuclease ABC subunit UvrA [Phycisphaerales bacterium]|nr:excinuclease ABC subunit UvrA [Phycisphaerales bacterium]
MSQDLSPIVIKGARMHNLKNVSVSIPKNKLVVVTGVSGSGKSSLVIDTLFAEGQRRYVESLSSYARQFMDRIPKPEVDQILGICPAIAIEQKVSTNSTSSTVGTLTEIYDYFRLLYSRIGKIYSPVSGKLVEKDDVQTVLKFVQSLPLQTNVVIVAPLKKLEVVDLSSIKLNKKNKVAKKEQVKPTFKALLERLLQKGFTKLYLVKDKQRTFKNIEDLLTSSENELDSLMSKEHNSFLVVDRLVTDVWSKDEETRLTDSIALAFYEGEGYLSIDVNGNDLHSFSEQLVLDDIVFQAPEPNLFSFNNPIGVCTKCAGRGIAYGIVHKKALPDKHLSFNQGAVAIWKKKEMNSYREMFEKYARETGRFPLDTPIEQLSSEEYNFLWEAPNGIYSCVDQIEKNYNYTLSSSLNSFRNETTCRYCRGSRLNKIALYIKVQGVSIDEVVNKNIKDLKLWLNQLSLSAFDKQVAKRILIEINTRVDKLIKMGLGYLSLNRQANTLSGGETQRIQLTKSLGSNLCNSLYILDEPSVGLHARDTMNLIEVLKELRDLGNTVVVVEHDSLLMQEADFIIDMGPYAAHLGGEVVATGTFNDLITNAKSLTARYLRHELTVAEPRIPRVAKHCVGLSNATLNNLKNVSVDIPLGVFCVVTGVSGSGKSSLIKDLFVPLCAKHYENNMISVYEGLKVAKKHGALNGDLSYYKTIELIDQNSIGRSSRSNPATYIGAFDYIRSLFAKLPLSKQRKYFEFHFSFNSYGGGRCEACEGEGTKRIEMQFLADIIVVCDVCQGKRFQKHILEVTYKDKNIYDVLNESVDDALKLFSDDKNIVDRLQSLHDVGLGYIKLGQSVSTLSGGEAQRLKLATFLLHSKQNPNRKTIYVFDEPTTGLHFFDVGKLIVAFQNLVDLGNSLIVIEHNIDVIKSADWVIEMGPDAGVAGGTVVFSGTVADLKKCSDSTTAPFLK